LVSFFIFGTAFAARIHVTDPLLDDLVKDSNEGGCITIADCPDPFDPPGGCVHLSPTCVQGTCGFNITNKYRGASCKNGVCDGQGNCLHP